MRGANEDGAFGIRGRPEGEEAEGDTECAEFGGELGEGWKTDRVISACEGLAL